MSLKYTYDPPDPKVIRADRPYGYVAGRMPRRRLYGLELFAGLRRRRGPHYVGRDQPKTVRGERDQASHENGLGIRVVHFVDCHPGGVSGSLRLNVGSEFNLFQ